ncbi:MAG: hypothetical protein UY95_C0018G0005 [Parcubacteria group bacterium GW2011_GWA2_56_7]|nr:MAG: hypothetical protein UY95_C0018G0005 [Parcubacteria group bacterium GW2011_GWA2_56_7]
MTKQNLVFVLAFGVLAILFVIGSFVGFGTSVPQDLSLDSTISPTSEEDKLKEGENAMMVPSADEHPLIRLTNPRPNERISSPLLITGEARGYWFFEATFPVVLTNWDGLIIAQGYATALDEWMTEDFVPFSATLDFDPNQVYPRGALILQKSNPSGLPEHDDAFEIPIFLF